MSNATQYLFVGEHADTLASGRRVAPGDELPASAVDTTDPDDQRLLADGTLVDLSTPAPADDLTRLSRDELDARAAALGVENPNELPNKDAVITAIQDKETNQ